MLEEPSFFRLENPRLEAAEAEKSANATYLFSFFRIGLGKRNKLPKYTKRIQKSADGFMFLSWLSHFVAICNNGRQMPFGLIRTTLDAPRSITDLTWLQCKVEVLS